MPKPNLLVINRFLRSKNLPFPNGKYSIVYLNYKMNKFIASALYNTNFKLYIIDPSYIDDLSNIYTIHHHKHLQIKGIPYLDTIYKQFIPIKEFWRYEKYEKEGVFVRNKMNNITSVQDALLEQIEKKVVLKDYIDLKLTIEDKLLNLDSYSHSGISKYISYGIIPPSKLYDIVDEGSPLKRNLLYRDYCYGVFSFFENRLFEKKKYDNFNFIKWKDGTTGEPLVDACMREFKINKHLSNTHKEIVACFWLNIYGGDWRVGEEYLREDDYDEAISKVNWWYLAGLLGEIRKSANSKKLEKNNKLFIYQNIHYYNLRS